MDITLIGEAASGAIKERSGAKPGDAVLVTGYPGQAAAGLEMLLNFASGVDVKDHPLVRHFLKPDHRAREGRTAAATGLVSAMIDISDGLLGDLGHICDRSRVGARLTRTALPVHENLIRASETMGRDVYDFVLGASDDYELIITCPQQNIPEIRTTVEAIASVPVREIGVVTAKAGLMTIVEPDGGERDITPKGWNHFA
jgi:thiamine-monophosphate kinase